MLWFLSLFFKQLVLTGILSDFNAFEKCLFIVFFLKFYYDQLPQDLVGSELWKSFKINLLSGTDLASNDFYGDNQAGPEMDQIWTALTDPVFWKVS